MCAECFCFKAWGREVTRVFIGLLLPSAGSKTHWPGREPARNADLGPIAAGAQTPGLLSRLGFKELHSGSFVSSPGGIRVFIPK